MLIRVIFYWLGIASYGVVVEQKNWTDLEHHSIHLGIININKIPGKIMKKFNMMFSGRYKRQAPSCIHTGTPLSDDTWHLRIMVTAA